MLPNRFIKDRFFIHPGRRTAVAGTIDSRTRVLNPPLSRAAIGAELDSEEANRKKSGFARAPLVVSSCLWRWSGHWL